MPTSLNNNELALMLLCLCLLLPIALGYSLGQKLVHTKPSARDKGMLFNSLILTLSGLIALLVYGPLTGVFIALLLVGLAICLGSDYADYTLPDSCTLGLTALGLAASTVLHLPSVMISLPNLVNHNNIFANGFINSAIGGIVGFGMMYALAATARAMYGREAVGGGDIKLMAAVGTWFGWSAPIFVLVAGAVFGLILSLSSRFKVQKGEPAQVPFGPPMIYSMIFWIFGGYKIMEHFGNQIKVITEALGK